MLSHEQSVNEYGSGLQDTYWHPYYTPQGFSNLFLAGGYEKSMLGNFMTPYQSPTNPVMYPGMHGEPKPCDVVQASHHVMHFGDIRYPPPVDMDVYNSLNAETMPTDYLAVSRVKNEEDHWFGTGVQRPAYNEKNDAKVTRDNQSVGDQTSVGSYVETAHIDPLCTSNNLQRTSPIPDCTSTERSFDNNPLNDEQVLGQEPISAYKCQECSRGYATPRSLAVHKRSHSGEKPYGCNLCSKRFNQWNVWSMHMKAHAGTKDFVCPLCHKAFSQSGHLFTHMQNHQNIKKHACEICKKRFIGKGDLIRHQRSHTGEKPFSCCQCTRRFSRKESLKYHLFLHDDVRPHNCPLCSKSYTKISTLKTHFKKVHNVGDLDSFITHRPLPNKSARNKANK